MNNPSSEAADTPIRTAIIGCGTVSQTIHIPNLKSLESFQIVAICDTVRDRADGVADRSGVNQVFYDPIELYDACEIDAVLVCTPPYARVETILPAVERGLHVFAEKPLSITTSDANVLVDAAEKTDTIAMVGYMKRYDPGFERTDELVDTIEDLKVVSAVDVDADHGAVISEVHNVIGDAPRDWERQREKGGEELGSDRVDVIDAYTFYLEHGCHVINALRSLLGEVTDIRHVELFDGGTYSIALLEFSGEHRCVFESGVTDRKWYDSHLRFNGETQQVTLQFPNPFIQNLPSTVRIRSGTDVIEDATEIQSFKASFERELRHFARCIETGAEPRTTFAEARTDIEVIREIVTAGSSDLS